MSCVSVKDDIPVQIIADAVSEKISNFDNMAQASTDYIMYCMDSDLSLFSEYIVLYPFSGTEYTEIGIFKIGDKENIDEGIVKVKQYLDFKKQNWDTRYMGDEFKKIESAKIDSYGKYIIYTILDENESKDVIKEFKNQLK